MAYKMKGFKYPGTSPLDQLSAANKKANKMSPFHKGKGGIGGNMKRRVPDHGEESHGGGETVDYEETPDDGFGTDSGKFHKGWGKR